MKKIFLILLIGLTSTIFARSDWRKAQMTGKTPKSAGHRARRAEASPVRPDRSAQDAVATRGSGHGSQARDSISFADEHYFRGRTKR